jgi:hypothetical protein
VASSKAPAMSLPPVVGGGRCASLPSPSTFTSRGGAVVETAKALLQATNLGHPQQRLMQNQLRRLSGVRREMIGRGLREEALSGHRIR